MIGKSQIQITATQMAGGLATSDYLGDGGIGMLSSNINPVNLPGTITATTTSTLANPATFACINLIATAEDPEIPTSSGRIAVDQNGNWYRYSFSTNSHIATGTPGAYNQPQTDMISFNGLSFASTTNNIARLIVGSGSLSEGYWTVTLGQGAMNANYPHPMLVYQKLAWVADGNNLNNWTSGGSPVGNTGVLVLRTGETITALGVDPGTGLMMIGVSSQTDGTAQLSASNFILLYDGYSSTERRRIPVEGHVSCFNNVGGTMFVAIDASIGTWNGNGVTFLRRFSEVGYPPNYALIKQRVSSFQNHLLVAAGANVYGFGDIQNGKKVWYPLYTANTRIDVVVFICNDQGVTFPLSPLVLVGTTNTGSGALISTLVQPYGSGAGTGTFYTNNINFPRPVFIRHMRVFTTGITTTTGVGSVGIIDETQTMHNPVSNKFVVASTATPKYVFDFPFAGQKLSTLQPVITLDTQAFSVTKIIIYYDTAE